MLKAKKSLSQNFLVDKNICKKIVNQTSIKNEYILEIGPGYGILTDMILKKTKKIYLIEKDTELSKYLKIKYKSLENIIVINEDILKFDLNNKEKFVIVSNLPYNVGTKIILYLFQYNDKIKEMIVMLQKKLQKNLIIIYLK